MGADDQIVKKGKTYKRAGSSKKGYHRANLEEEERRRKARSKASELRSKTGTKIRKANNKYVAGK